MFRLQRVDFFYIFRKYNILRVHLPKFESVYFGLKNQYKMVLSIVKKKNFIVYDANKNI